MTIDPIYFLTGGANFRGHHGRHNRYDNWCGTPNIMQDLFDNSLRNFSYRNSVFGWNPPFYGHNNRYSYQHRYHESFNNNWGWNSGNNYWFDYGNNNGNHWWRGGNQHRPFHGHHNRHHPGNHHWTPRLASDLVEQLAWGPYLYGNY